MHAKECARRASKTIGSCRGAEDGMATARAQVPEHCQICKLGWVPPKDSYAFTRGPVRLQLIRGYGEGNGALNPFVRHDFPIRNRRELCSKRTEEVLSKIPSADLGVRSALQYKNRSKRICGVPLGKNAVAFASAPKVGFPVPLEHRQDVQCSEIESVRRIVMAGLSCPRARPRQPRNLGHCRRQPC